jgi:peptide deformylase
MAGLRKIIQLGCPALRRLASPVDDPGSPEVQGLIDDLIATLMDSGGVGIAAPQVNVPLRLFIIVSRSDPGHGEAPDLEPMVIINPEIIARSPEVVKGWEGCLSVPGIRGLVPRHKSVTLRYTTREGIREEQEFLDLAARICQHEYDHLEGLTYLDRLESVKDIISDSCYQAPSSGGQACLAEKPHITGMP